jgi:hypothetical protein
MGELSMVSPEYDRTHGDEPAVWRSGLAFGNQSEVFKFNMGYHPWIDVIYIRAIEFSAYS